MAPNFSRLVSDALDCIGYSDQSIKIRAQVVNKMYDTFSKHYLELWGASIILAGSKSEGVVPLLGSDIDVMCVLPFCVSVDHGRLEDGLTILETNSDGCPPGYTKLRPIHIDNKDNHYIFKLCSFYDISSGTRFLRSAAFSELLDVTKNVNLYDGFKQFNKKLSGPALSVTTQPCLLMGINQGHFNSDLVIALPYYTSSILQEWAERKRYFDWPPHDVVDDVSTTEGFVVPVGHNLSEEQILEWRICYTPGERKLIASLNETHIKIYVLLKMVFKDIINPTIDCVSSYMIKNVVFWVAEHNPITAFTLSNLVRGATHALWILLHCLRNNLLPNYMIPGRNLFIGKIQSQQKTVLKELLEEQLNKGETFVLSCEKLRNAFYIAVANRCLATRLRSWRDEIEQLLLLFNLYAAQKLSRNTLTQRTFIYDLMFECWRDKYLFMVMFRLFHLLQLDFTDILGYGVTGIQKIGDILQNLLS